MMENNGFSSPRNDSFPAGLRVLVVDDDPTWLKILEKMLKKCSYEVKVFSDAGCDSIARFLASDHTCSVSHFHLKCFVSDHMRCACQLTVMSVDGETSRVMKGVQHGACDYLLKPIRMKELRNIWQHVFRKKIHEVRDIETLERVESFQMTRNGSDHYEDGHVLCGEDLASIRKRKHIESKHDEKDTGDSISTKKARVVWSVDLHQKFVKANFNIFLSFLSSICLMSVLDFEKYSSLEMLSYMQKYRLYLSRLQKENNFKTPAGGIKQSDSPLRDSAGSFGSQNSINLQHNDFSNGSYGFAGSSLVVHNGDPRSHDSDRKRLVSTPVEEPKRTLTVNVPNPCIPRSSQMEFGHPLAPPQSEVDFGALDSTLPTKYPWCGIQLKKEHNPLHLNDEFSHLPLPGQKQLTQADYPQPAPAISSAPSLTPSHNEYRSTVNHASSTAIAVDSSPIQTKTNMENHQAVDPNSKSTPSLENQGFNMNSITEFESSRKNINLGMLPFTTLEEDLQVCWVPGDCNMNLGLQNMEVLEYFDPGLITDVPVNLNDGLRFDYEFNDPTEYSLIDQSLFIA
ncbi:hypothetical protein POTOM_030420 [Populus tomentosa]|uniref:Response regulatory domain-containing protein n=1 Tax=Populus tomentosa TaxID=118781 RepID=A0A8X7Z778_POPTO|nr:hypothetical protein POTOM_030420 [Populus tomentosa]